MATLSIFKKDSGSLKNLKARFHLIKSFQNTKENNVFAIYNVLT